MTMTTRLLLRRIKQSSSSSQLQWTRQRLHHDSFRSASSSNSIRLGQTPPAVKRILPNSVSQIRMGSSPRFAFSSAVSNETMSDVGSAVTCRLSALIDQGDVQPDEHQFEAAAELDRIYDHLMANDPPPLLEFLKPKPKQQSSSFFGGLWGSKMAAAEYSLPPSVSNQGAYMFGGVGCGKTFLMNLFYDAVDSGPWAKDKQKVHFHKFMLQVHQHMHQQRKVQKDPNGDLIAPVVDEILKQGRLLCLDEFQVTDVADAMILQLLFDGLWKKGCILVATSNRPPSDLYLHGLQRDRFLPFIDRLQKQCNVVDLLDSETDYRMLANAMSSVDDGDGSNSSGSSGSKPLVYYTKGDPNSSKQFRKLFHRLAESHPTNPTSLSTQGRTVPIPLACIQKRIAYFEFSDVCQKAMGAADYLVIAHNFSTVFCHNIPKLTIHELNWLRRFITFVDTMYELKVTLILHTAQPVDSVRDLFSVEGDKKSYSQDEVFAFDRTLSRLEEMSSPKYLKSQWLGGSKKKRLDEQKQELSSSSAAANWFLHRRKSKEEEDAEDEHNKVTTKLALQPSLGNHHRQTGLAETSTLEESTSSSSSEQQREVADEEERSSAA